MRPTADSEWIYGDEGVSETADTERPPGPAFWRCDGDGFEPAAYATLIEASGEKPATPDAIIAGGGALLAQSAEDVAQWIFSPAGMAQVEAEMQAAIDRDYDSVIGIVLAQDLRAVGQ